VEALTQTLQGYLGLGIMDVDSDPLRGDEIIEMVEEFGPRPVEGEALAQAIETAAAQRDGPSVAAGESKPKRSVRPKPKARADTPRLRAKLV
jgi:hypothetical protein